MDIREEIRALKEREQAVILAHYYAPDEVQAIADYVGDSFFLAKAAAKTEAKTIVFCGVHFMGESAKILNPSRRVLMPDLSADCAMAHMATAEQIRRLTEAGCEIVRVAIPDMAAAEAIPHTDIHRYPTVEKELKKRGLL